MYIQLNTIFILFLLKLNALEPRTIWISRANFTSDAASNVLNIAAYR